jgi:hypothetical protein
MNAFVEHHKNSIQFGYRCFDRLLLNGLIQPFQQPERVLGFFNTYRDGKRVTRKTLTEIADQFQYWLKNRSKKWDAPILEAPEGKGTRAVGIGSWMPTSKMQSPTKWWRSSKRGNRRGFWWPSAIRTMTAHTWSTSSAG